MFASYLVLLRYVRREMRSHQPLQNEVQDRGDKRLKESATMVEYEVSLNRPSVEINTVRVPLLYKEEK